MKKTITSIFLFPCFMFLLINCDKTTSASKIRNPIKKQEAEDFNSFLGEFYSDSIFQKSRIIFPLESDVKTEEEYSEALKDSNVIEANKKNYISHNRDNWNVLSDSLFRNDSITTIEGIKYIRRFHKTNTFVEENILFADDELVMIVLKFKLIKSKWYLYDYKDGFADE
jgi:hypothetical protein